MNFTILYLFCALSLVSCLLAVFSFNIFYKTVTFSVFLLSVSGIFTLLNSGYISFIIMIMILGYHSYKSLNQMLTEQGNGDHEMLSPANNIQLLIISLMGAIIASVSGSTMWQGNVYFRKEITLANFGETIGGEYFIFFLVIFASAFLVSSNLKQIGEKQH